MICSEDRKMEHKILILRVSNDVTYSNDHDSVKSLQALNIHQDTSAVNAEVNSLPAEHYNINS